LYSVTRDIPIPNAYVCVTMLAYIAGKNTHTHICIIIYATKKDDTYDLFCIHANCCHVAYKTSYSYRTIAGTNL